MNGERGAPRAADSAGISRDDHPHDESRTPPAAPGHETGATPPAPPGTDAQWSIRHAAVTAGSALLVMSVLAGFAKVVALDGLVTHGNAAQTATDIMGSSGLFRLGIIFLILVIALDIVVAWGLYRVFSPVSRSVSLLAAAFRLVFAAAFLAAIGQLTGVLRMLGDDASVSAFGVEQRQSQALAAMMSFYDVWDIALLLCGVHLVLIGYLAYRSGYAPRLLGGLLAVAGLGYVFDSIGVVISQGTWTAVSSVTFVGEFLLALWLVIRGPRLTVHTDPRGDPVDTARRPQGARA